MTLQLTRRCAAISLCSLFLPQAVISAPSPPSGGELLSFELTGVSLPIVQGSALVNYVFSAIRVQMADLASTIFFRENAFLLRDAIIKIASRSPIPALTTRNSFDRVAVTRVVLRAIEAVRPGARVVRVSVLDAAFMRT